MIMFRCDQCDLDYKIIDRGRPVMLCGCSRYDQYGNKNRAAISNLPKNITFIGVDILARN